jgi:outer membrane lipoprotein SlyB
LLAANAVTSFQSMSVPAILYEDDRPRRRDRACLAIGVAAGAGVGVAMGAFAWLSVALLGALGAVAGGVLGRLIASRISADEWDPRETHRPYVGANSPDDDIARD